MLGENFNSFEFRSTVNNVYLCGSNILVDNKFLFNKPSSFDYEKK